MQRIKLELRPLELKSQEIMPPTLSPASQTYPRATTLWQSFGYALAGIWYVLRSQRNAKIHAGIAVMVTLLGLFLGVSPTQWAILALTMGLVFSAEMFNTVVEALVDLTSPDLHPLAKVAKDVAAGAVFFLAIMSVLVGSCILGPPLWQLMAAHIF